MNEKMDKNIEDIEYSELPMDISSVVVIGKESVGKSQLIASLTNRYAITGNFRGTTIACDKYSWEGIDIIDTPGILRDIDSKTTRIALSQLEKQDIVMLVISATHIDQDLDYMLPLVQGKLGVIVVTFWDKVTHIDYAFEKIEKISKEANMPLITVDARKLNDSERKKIINELNNPKHFPDAQLKTRANWIIEPTKTIFEKRVLGKVFSLLLLVVPAVIAVKYANSFANICYQPLYNLIKPILDSISLWHVPLNYIFGGKYGFISMMPFLILYAVPTVIVFAVILSIYKTTGIIDRLTISLDSITRLFGISGRDLIRIIMGFGCNVPAIFSTRSCSIIQRPNCVSAISFGSACSYQLPATIAVFNAAGVGYLTYPYLAILVITTAIYLRCTAENRAELSGSRLLIEGRSFLQWPSFKSTSREAWSVMQRFYFKALPIFFIICTIASLLAWLGVIDFLSKALSSVMAIFNLPGESVLAIILGSIRKDGIAIGLLNENWDSLKTPLDSPVQVLTIVYLAGVFLPCLVTTITIFKELQWKFLIKMALKQAFFSIIFSLVVAWGGKLIFG